MHVVLGSDHAGFQLKEDLKKLLEGEGHSILDVGTYSTESVDYPDFAALVAKRVGSGEVERGILICGTGIGMAISANKMPTAPAPSPPSNFGSLAGVIWASNLLQ